MKKNGKSKFFLNGEKINICSLFKIVGIVLHVPAIMAFLSIIVCLFYKEYFAIFSLFLFSLIVVFIGQFLYRIFKKVDIKNLFEAMVGAALAWFFCSIICAFVYFLIANKLSSIGQANESVKVFLNFINCSFESFSGFTSTGLTMVKFPSKLPHILQWWRSFQAWIGAMGLVIFIISLIEPRKEEYRLYLAEAKSEQVGKDIRNTLQKIWFIYFLYTVCLVFLFFISKMEIWDSINHAMTCIGTGGFSVSDTNLAKYSLSAQIVAILGMIFGSISFSMHYRVFKERKFLYLWKSMQHRLLFIFFISGILISIGIHFISIEKIPIFSYIFSFSTSLSTCGFSVYNMNSFSFAAKLFFIFAMIIGGASGSTCGGLKVRRIKNLFSAVLLRIKSITKKQEEEIIEEIEETKEREVAEIKLPATQKTSRLYSASILFFLWIFVLALGWFLILLTLPHISPINALFDAASALGNVGLFTTAANVGISSFTKIVFIFLMYLGRLEIIPIIILFFSIFQKIKNKYTDPQ